MIIKPKNPNQSKSQVNVVDFIQNIGPIEQQMYIQNVRSTNKRGTAQEYRGRQTTANYDTGHLKNLHPRLRIVGPPKVLAVTQHIPDDNSTIEVLIIIIGVKW